MEEDKKRINAGGSGITEYMPHKEPPNIKIAGSSECSESEFKRAISYIPITQWH